MDQLEKNLVEFTRLAMETIAFEFEVHRASSIIITALKQGNSVFATGNGGSMAEAQHFIAELDGRFLQERGPLKGILLPTDLASFTAISNDYGYDVAMERQLRGLSSPGDVLVTLSTSGRSKNILALLQAAPSYGVKTILMTGATKPEGVKPDAVITVPSSCTARIQEMHLVILHTICEIIDEDIGRKLYGQNNGSL